MTAGSTRDMTAVVLAQLTPAFTVTGCVLAECTLLLGTDTGQPTLIAHPELCDPTKG